VTRRPTPGADGPAGEGAAGPDSASPADEPDGAGREPSAPVRRGVDVARGALAAAKAEAKRRGMATRSGGGGRRTGDTGSGERRRWRASDDSRSGAHPDERDPQTLDASLGRLVVERGWETDAKVGGVMGRWAAVVGPDLAAHCEPVSFEDGELVVAASSTAWATQLRLLAPSLVRRLCEEAGEDLVTQVTVQGPRPPSWKRGPLTVRGRGPRDTYG
jgi:predicted nucleic acid-binding Zn ribbon protein